jgi:predicted permease
MSLRAELRERLRALLHRGREDRELEEELAFHLEMETDENVRRGLPPAEARRRAHMAMGGGDVVREQVRDARGTRLLEDLKRDLALGLRMLGKRKEFTVVMLLVLALGIGANTATFTVMDALLLRPLPKVPDPHELVAIGNPNRPGSMSVGTPSTQGASYPLFEDVRDAQTVFTGLYASGRTERLNVLLDGATADAAAEPEHPRARFVSGEFFRVLEVPAQLGRTFVPEDDAAAAGAPTVVVSHAFWQSKLGGGPDAVGRVISVNGVPATVIGVAPHGFIGDVVGSAPDLWLPLAAQPTLMPHEPHLDRRDVSWLLMMGRLRPGATLEQARAEIKGIEERVLLENADADDRGLVERQIRERPVTVGEGARGFSGYRETLAKPLLTLMAAVALVLLVACANVASLALVRATSRTREMGVRMALGAGRGRVVRQLLAESLVVATMGGVLGLVLAQWGSTLLLRLASGGSAPIPLDVGLDPRMLAFTAAVSLGTALVFGVMPAFRATRATASLRSQGRGIQGADSGADRLPAGRVLVVAQVALSMVLLVGTGMLVRSMGRMRDADLGFDRSHTVVGWVDAGRGGYDQVRAAELRRQVVERVARIPGVAAVSYSENGVFSGTNSGTTLQVEGFTARSEEDTLIAYDDVGPGYFEAIGGRVAQGREFLASDDEAGDPVAILDETAARFFFGGGSPLGRHVTIGDRVYRIVGVTTDAEQQDLRAEREGRLYVPMAQIAEKPSWFYLVARTEGDPAAAVEPIRQAIREIDPNLPVMSMDPVSSLIEESLAEDIMLARVVTGFGALAMLLAGVGLFGLMAYGAARRTSEFGLRMALGARRQTLTRMMLGEALGLVVLGLVLGVPAAVGAARLLESQLFGIDGFDPPSVLLATAVLLVSALVAGAVPAIRAGRASPLESLRAE